VTEGFAVDLGDWFATRRSQVSKDLDKYFGGTPKSQFTGRWFEKFAALGDPYRFEASDILAVEALSVSVPSESAARLLVTEADRFNALLRQIPSDEDLWEQASSVVGAGGAAQALHSALDDLKGVGWVTAGKLIAAKRPSLIPILDKEVRDLLKPPKKRFWITMHDELSDPNRRQVISKVCAGAPADVSLLRRIDVALWMHATQSR
jgi:Family of unknown function (DUF6308)